MQTRTDLIKEARDMIAKDRKYLYSFVECDACFKALNHRTEQPIPRKRNYPYRIGS